jgi:hypothetical protein
MEKPSHAGLRLLTNEWPKRYTTCFEIVNARVYVTKQSDSGSSLMRDSMLKPVNVLIYRFYHAHFKV